jgi:hypothetical protein
MWTDRPQQLRTRSGLRCYGRPTLPRAPGPCSAALTTGVIRMGIDDMMGQAKDLLGSQSEAVDGAIDQAAQVIKDKTPDQVDGAVDQAAQVIKEKI